jgi:acyl-CoA reductase-like NAD-dependent aldehyde dehydrogenase
MSNQIFAMTINGKQVVGKTTIDIVNPASGKPFAQAPNASIDDLNAAVNAAQQAFPSWRALSIERRADYLRRAADALILAAAELAPLFTREQGRPLAMAQQEIEGAGQWINSVTALKPPVEIVEDSDSQWVETQYLPLGVVGAIVPWNFPVSGAMLKIAPALLAGNTVILKPSPFTPLCILRIGELFGSIFPPGVLNVITGDDQLGPLMTQHPGIHKIAFTGSTSTGRKVMADAAGTLKKVTLELGGNDAAIVLPDVDVDKIAEQLFFGAFYNTAQICVATKRLYVHTDVYDQVLERLSMIAQSARVGDGMDPDTVLGPIQNRRQYERLKNLIADARANGLKLVEGCPVPDSDGFFIPVILVDDPPENARVVREEAFGPILPLLKFDNLDDVVARVNDSEYGLAAAVWSSNIDAAKALAQRIDTGTVWINQNLNLRPDASFAGHKQSGAGVENGVQGLLEYMIPRTIYVAKHRA